MATTIDRHRHPITPADKLVLDVDAKGPDRVVVTARGEMCGFSAPAVASRLRPAVDAAGRTLVLDLRNVTFFAAAAIRVLVEVRRRADDVGVRIELLPSSPVERVLRLCGLGDLIATAESTSSAEADEVEVEVIDLRVATTAPAPRPASPGRRRQPRRARPRTT